MSGATCNTCGLACGGPVPSALPGVCVCDGEQQFTSIEDTVGKNTLIASLTPCIDAIRNISSALGARQYSVSLVWTRWSGGERGAGNESIVEVLELLPTPQVASLTGLAEELESVGLNEQGALTVTEISPRFDEDFLMGRGRHSQKAADFPRDMNFYWEVSFIESAGNGIRRRFFPKAAPSKNPTKFEWVVDLVRANDDRNRDGTLH